MTQKEQIIDLLKKHTKMPLADMEVMLNIDGKTIQTQISMINHSRNKFQSIRIHRTGKNGNSNYEIQDGNTRMDVVYGSMDKTRKKSINALFLYRDYGLLAVANAQSQALRNQIVKDINARKNILLQQISVATI